jgi:CheY-like chemotaxis protein
MASITRVLILDDDPKVADALGRLLELYSHSVKASIAYTGLSTLYLAGTGNYEVILIDLHLGEDDGFDVAKAIRTSGSIYRPKLIAMSQFREKVTQARTSPLFDHALNKPLFVKELFDAIQSVQPSSATFVLALVGDLATTSNRSATFRSAIVWPGVQ